MLIPAALLAAPFVALACLLRPRWRRSLRDRLGIGWPQPQGSPVLWAHAASVGEVEGIAPLVRRWRDAHPAGDLVVSALTETGCEAARRLLPEARVRVFPLDLPLVAGRVVRRVSPSLFLFSENELWPNVLFSLHRRGVPVVQVSGRLSAGAAATLARVPRFARAVLGWVTRFCVQQDEHRARLVDLGVAPERVVVTGSLKADAGPAAAPEFLGAIRALGRPVVVAGSTHPGEEETVLEAVAELAGRSPPPFWLLAPRHPERFAAVAAMIERRGVRMRRRSSLPPGDPGVAELLRCDVLLLDTLGELAGCYGGAAAAFVGGSLVPVGGHNLLEPARAGVPVVTGPHLESVAALACALREVGAAAIARSGTELAEAVAGFLDAPPGRPGQAARAVADRLSGSLPLTWSSILEVAGRAEEALHAG